MKKIQFSGVLFDLDGTLLDTAPEFKVALNQLLQAENKPTLTDELPAHALGVAVNNGLAGLIKLGFGADLDPTYYETLITRLSKHYFNQLGEMSTLFPGMALCLEQLKTHNSPWGIVTNKPQKFTLPLIKKISQFRESKVIVSGDTLAYSKPHPAPLYYACEKMKLDTHNVLYVGDAKRDMEAAIAANMKCALAAYGYLSPDDPLHSWGANYHLEQAEQLIKLILC